jgi:hypothetical protein
LIFKKVFDTMATESTLKHPLSDSEIKQEGQSKRPCIHREVQDVTGDQKKPAYNNEASATASASAAQDDDDDDDVRLMGQTGPTALADFPHARSDCVVHAFKEDALKYCDNCFCYVCDKNASECSQWQEHCQAQAGDSHWEDERRKNKSIPEGLFDVDVETKKHGCMYRYGEELHARAKNHKYFYQDEATFLAAMELYNREGAILRKRNLSGYDFDEWHVIRKWERMEVRGAHKKPCRECDEQFERDTHRYYLIENSNGPMGADKRCIGCMGRTLCFNYGLDKTAITKKLETIREKQDKIFCYLREYEDQYLQRRQIEDQTVRFARLYRIPLQEYRDMIAKADAISASAPPKPNIKGWWEILPPWNPKG